MKILHIAGATALLGLVGLSALAQPVTPQVTVINPTDLFQDLPNGSTSYGNQYASGAMLSGYFAGTGPGGDNFLIGGDAGTNLFQRGTTGATQNTTVAYGGPDRWVYWSGASTNITLNRISTAATLPTGTQFSFQLKLANSQTGTVQVCKAQEISSQNAFYLAGHTVELDFNAYAGAAWTSSAVNAYIITGTGTDEGTTNLAFGLNAGGGGAAGWTGQANATSGALTMAVSTMYRGMAVAAIPSTATEVAVALCFTPSGTSSGTSGNDYVAFSNIELRKADWLSAWANTTTAYSVSTANGTVQAKINGVVQNTTVPPFSRRAAAIEALLQLQYYWQLNEPAASLPVSTAAGAYYTTTLCEVPFQFPVPMRAAPTVAFGGTALSNATFAIIANSATPIVLATTFLVQSSLSATNTVYGGRLKATTAGQTAGQACMLVGAGGGANIQWSAEL